MSKAFAGEMNSDDFAIELPALPPGVRNYMTPAGEKALKAEVARLEAARARFASDRVEDQAQRDKIDQRLRALGSRLEVAQVIDPLQQPVDRVLFGATVTLQDEKGKQESWRIVGIDEANLDRGWISWMSPLSNTLLEKRVGDTFPFLNRRLTLIQITHIP